MGMGAWVASFCFLGFFAILHVVDSPASAIFCGVLLAGAATALRYGSRHDAAVQLSLSLCLAGRALVYGGLSDSSPLLAGAVAFALEGAMVLFYPDPVNRFISTGGMWMAVVFLLDRLHAPPWTLGLATTGLGALTALAWEHQARLTAGRWSRHHIPVAMALPVALLGTLLIISLNPGVESSLIRVSAAGLTLVFLGFLARVLREHAAPRPWLWVGVAALVGLLTSSTPALVASLLVLGLGFHRRQPLLMGLAAGTLVVSGVFFYYHLDLTLLVKAGVLVASGAILLAARAWLEIERRRAS
jgi:hypothetical protein